MQRIIVLLLFFNLFDAHAQQYDTIYKVRYDTLLDKAEGLAIINDSTLAIGNDNDFGQTCPLENGIPIATNNTSHVVTYRLQGKNKIANLKQYLPLISQGITGPNSSQTPYFETKAPLEP